MRVTIGKYLTYVGPYQLAELLKKVGVSEDRCYSLGEWLAGTWVNDACQWIYNKRSRTIQVRIDEYDTWSADSTLALIILPMLQKLKAEKHGSPFVEDEDVPEHFRKAADPDWSEQDMYRDGSVDKNFHARWDYIIDEMIWAFDQMQPGRDGLMQFYGEGKTDTEGYNAYNARMQNGTRLFGRYYQGLWD